MTDSITGRDRLARLRGIREEVREQENSDYRGYLDMMKLYDRDPLTEDPFTIPSTFISEQVGGQVAVVDQDDEHLADENLNQFLSNFLPGGYRQRWGFDRYRGNWHYDSDEGFADVGPMIDRSDEYELSTVLENAEIVPYGPIAFDVDDVRVYVPGAMQVTNENLNREHINYVWLSDRGIVWTGNPPVPNVQQLTSDPTMNVLWFKHPLEEPPALSEPVDESELFVGYGFTDAIEFLRCYYASLLTMYPEGTTQTMSGIVRYRNEDDDTVAFLGSEEQSQLLTFGLDRKRLRARIQTALEANPGLRRDLQFSFLHTLIQNILFFEEEAIPHEFAVEPLVEHLVGVDYRIMRSGTSDLGVFGLSGGELTTEIEQLLPGDSSHGLKNRLRLLGYSAAEDSEFYDIVTDYEDEFSRILAICRNDGKLLDFAERVAVHSAEHALATWSNEYTGSGTSFELWYDVNFQEGATERARIAMYDPIQGGAGIAKEVAEKYASDDNADIVTGIRNQGRCHTGVTDRAAVELLAEHGGKSLYDLFHNDRDAFRGVVSETIGDVIDGDSYNEEDLSTQVKHRTRSLLETRELGAFYSYIAELHETVGDEITRTPRVADLALHLDEHVFRDPEVRSAYERFASDSGRRDLSELGERLDELTVGCINACPDCLQTDVNLCLHGNESQHARLNRRLLTEVFKE